MLGKITIQFRPLQQITQTEPYVSVTALAPFRRCRGGSEDKPALLAIECALRCWRRGWWWWWWCDGHQGGAVRVATSGLRVHTLEQVGK
ncbi:hypothetical protein JF55_05795 [Pseudomonas sp. 1-7]|nr:hypothetical protein JF55_05795 [Pseudomonas sp. 1-7]